MPAHAVSGFPTVGVTKQGSEVIVLYVPCEPDAHISTVRLVDLGDNEFLGGDDDRVLWEIEAVTPERSPSRVRRYVVGGPEQGFVETAPAEPMPAAPAALAAVVDGEVPEEQTTFELDELRDGEVLSEGEFYATEADFAEHVEETTCGDNGLFLSHERLERTLILVGFVALGVICAAIIGAGRSRTKRE
jgi:hypothetical protein